MERRPEKLWMKETLNRYKEVYVCVCGEEVLFPEREREGGVEMRDEWEGQRRAVCLYEVCSWIDESHCGLRLYLTGWLTAYLHIILWLTVLTCSNTSLSRGGGWGGGGGVDWFSKLQVTLYCVDPTFCSTLILILLLFMARFYWSNTSTINMTSLHTVQWF